MMMIIKITTTVLPVEVILNYFVVPSHCVCVLIEEKPATVSPGHFKPVTSLTGCTAMPDVCMCVCVCVCVWT
jgi:hypothetical protein